MPKVSEAIIGTLKEAGVKHVFGIPSIHNIGLYDALNQEPSIKHILCRHESSATHMADGYARASRGLTAVITSTGPGAMYMTAPLIEAWWNCSPVMAITSNIKADRIGAGTGTLHEYDDQDAAFRSITKGAFCPRTAQDAADMAVKAAGIALSGRPGPVYLEVPTDLWDQQVDPVQFKLPDSEGSIDNTGLDQAAAILNDSKNPVIICGTEAVRMGLEREVLALAEKISAPVITVANAKGIFPENHPLAFGNVSKRGIVREVISASDATLVIGSRLRNVDFGRRGVTLNRLIHIAPDSKWINKNFQADCALIGPMAAISAELETRIEHGPNSQARQDQTKEYKKILNGEIDQAKAEDMAVKFLDAIRDASPEESYLVIDNTMLGYYAEYFYQSLKSGGLVTAKGSSIIGFSFPAAIGCKIAHPEIPVAAVIGDGGFFYGAHELASCIKHNIGFPVVVVNDGAFGIINLLQNMIYGRGSETKLSNPNFIAFAQSFGVKGVSVDTPADLGQALSEAYDSPEMTLIELKASFDQTPFAKY